ncbi:MAG: DUF6175 family protein [Chloroherpetonaceae bacterium]|nr:DUF6175 family protein [Chloroherpetonaceae bacterium]MDW8437025.1 DUF6175 family protein [Chloroherpetonaceae bacterium]
MRILLASLSIAFFVLSGRSSVLAQLPQSREVVFVETFSASEVALKAKGIGKEVDDAENDARKAAIYYVLYGGTDALLQTDEEKANFKRIENEFFDLANVNRYITFFGNEMLSRVRLRDGVKIEKFVRVDKEKLAQDLAKRGVIAARADLAEAVGNPVIMVLPEVPKGQSPIEALQNDSELKKGAEVIESYLSARKYNVEVPEQRQVLADLVEAQSSLSNIETDIVYQLALTIGADIYITYTVQIEKGKFGNKASVGCRAFETTTGRLLGAETGYSPERPSTATAALIEEAMNSAIDKTLARLDAYWKQDLERGQQYKLIFRIVGEYKDLFEIGDAVEEVLKKNFTNSRQLAATERALDYVIWQREHDTPTKLYRALEKAINAHPTIRKNFAKLKRISVNRKLLLLAIDNAQE